MESVFLEVISVICDEGHSYQVRLAQLTQILAQNHAPKIGATV
jgi:hypothetical protein